MTCEAQPLHDLFGPGVPAHPACRVGAFAGRRASLAFRPAAKGDALDLRSLPTVPKPRGLIEAFEPAEGLRLEDRKLYNVMLAVAWDRSADPSASACFSAPAAAMRRAIGQAGAVDNRRLKESLRRLMQTTLSFPRLSIEGLPGDETGPLLSQAFLPKGRGTMEWSFPAPVRAALAAPTAWARLDLAVCARFRCRYALPLYERLSLRRNLRHPVWRVGADDLRRQLGAFGRLAGWDAFERRALRPALSEIAACADMDVAVETRRAARSGRVTEALFRLAGRAPRPAAWAGRLILDRVAPNRPSVR